MNHEPAKQEPRAALHGVKRENIGVAPSDERSTADVFIINGDDAFAVQKRKI